MQIDNGVPKSNSLSGGGGGAGESRDYEPLGRVGRRPRGRGIGAYGPVGPPLNDDAPPP